MVYVRLASGREVVLAGDVAWMMSGIETRRQKPDSVSRSLFEDRDAIAPQLQWLHDVATQGVVVIVAHDAARLEGLIRQGILTDDVDLRRP
jgi:hypothetical protein